MSEKGSTGESFTDQAIELEKKWSWLEAAELYEKALRLTTSENGEDKGNLLEHRAYALHKAAFQTDDYGVLSERTRDAIKTYMDAKSAYDEASEFSRRGRQLRCDAMIAYLSYWLAGTHVEKKKMVDEAWRKAKASLSVFESSGDSTDFALTFNQIAYAAAFSYNYDGSSEGRESTLREALSYAEKTVRHLSSSNRSDELARAHVKCTGLLVAIEKDFTPYSGKDAVDLSAWENWTKARGLSEEAAFLDIPFLIVLQSWPAACGTDERSAIYAKAKEVVEKSKDRFVIGCIFDGLAQRKLCLALSADDRPTIDRLSAEGLEMAKASKENLDVVRFTSPNVSAIWIPVPAAGYYYSSAGKESDPDLQRELFFKAHPLCIEQLKLAHESGYPDVDCAAHYMLGSVLKGLGMGELAPDIKRSYLERALEHLQEAVAVDKQIHPTQYYPQGQDLLDLADAEFEIAQITNDLEKKKNVLKEAVQRKQEALGLCEKELNATQDANPDFSGEIAIGYHTTGKWARALCTLTGDTSCLGVVAECLEKAVVWYRQAGLFSQSAECNWEAADAYDNLSEFARASERFELAAEDYSKAATSVPRLKEFYADYAIYMGAWSEIEQANYHHIRQEPGQAKGHYENASAMHKSSRRWNYLATNYSAWAEVEHAEDLSRNGNHDQAIEALEQAARLFKDSKNALHDQVSKIEDVDEEQMARDLERAANLRREYCKARTVLEKARSLDDLGDVSASSDMYGQAADLFDGIMPELDSDRDRRELQLMATLSRAWQAMARAESETSPDFYEKASELFDKAKDLSVGEKPKLLVSGHSRFCKALYVGAMFVDTGDVSLHAKANKHLESAADYYLKAGHQKESDYAKASKLLFDGYVYIGKANGEDDQGKKAKLYTMAEKVLQTSASSYEKAKEPSKRDQVFRLLEKVKEERELAMSLTEILSASNIATSMAAFPSPSPSHESATGRDRFEHADVQVVLIVNPKHVHVGQELEVVVEMTNVGKTVAQLKRLENLLPDGFSVVAKPDACRIEDNHLNMRGRHLDALTSEIVKLVLRANNKGRYTLRPRILYSDESGRTKDHTSDPVEVTVKELGLSGWLKGT